MKASIRSKLTIKIRDGIVFPFGPLVIVYILSAVPSVVTLLSDLSHFEFAGVFAGVPQFFLSLPLPPCWSLSHFVLFRVYLLGVADYRLGFLRLLVLFSTAPVRGMSRLLIMFVSYALSVCVLFTSLFYL